MRLADIQKHEREHEEYRNKLNDLTTEVTTNHIYRYVAALIEKGIAKSGCDVLAVPLDGINYNAFLYTFHDVKFDYFDGYFKVHLKTMSYNHKSGALVAVIDVTRSVNDRNSEPELIYIRPCHWGPQACAYDLFEALYREIKDVVWNKMNKEYYSGEK